jgi:hypothetical protein
MSYRPEEGSLSLTAKLDRVIFCFVKLTNRQKENIAKALFDISKLIMAIGTLGNTFGNKPFSLSNFVWASAAFAVCFVLAIFIDK